MSVIEYPDSINPPDLQIWNNAAFDNGGSEEFSGAVKSSWSLLQFVNRSESIGSEMSKENLSPNGLILKPLNQIGNSQGKPLKPLPKVSQFEPVPVRDERKIGSEIAEIENEIWRLSSKLESLRIEKIDRTVKGSVEKKGRIVPAKFMGQKSFDPPSAQSKLSRRGFSLGPAEIAARSRQLGKPEITPVQSIQNRRQSCLWKLQEIDERKVTKERGHSLSLSPKSRKIAPKIQAPKQPWTTIGSRKVSKKEDSFLTTIRPKKLFTDGEKPATAKKPARTGRAVPSRYSQIQSNGYSIPSERKRSLPEDSNDAIRAKKKWEIPSELVVYNGVEDNVTVSVSPLSVLPRIRTVRFGNDSPRDSGAAKRVAELIGRRSVFSPEEEELSVCQALTFADEC